MITECPASATSYAATSPDKPAPTTITSASMTSMLPWFPFDSRPEPVEGPDPPFDKLSGT